MDTDIDEDKKFNIEVASDGVIYLSLAGKLDGLNLVALDKWTKEVHIVIKDRYENTYVPVKVVINISAVTDYAPEAVTLLTNLLIQDKLFVHRSATYGGSQYILMAQDMLSSLSGRSNFKSFKTKEEAVEWVSETAS
ncbi:MAG: hypothetical protein Q7S34_02970 [bacterium]|nr:hypothetical protein [bacterium]